ncbi:MAG: SDR family NAD(P)-dependent oxidoreductase, partial [Raoultibacter sp.]
MNESPCKHESVESPARVAVVTGSSRGIGRAIACELARRGMNVCVNHSSARSMQAAQDTAAYLRDTYDVQTCVIQADVSVSVEAQLLIEKTKEALGRVDVLVNNAGITRDGLAVRMSEEDFDDVIATNLKGAFNCCKYAGAVMMKQRFGRIINVSSVAG